MRGGLQRLLRDLYRGHDHVGLVTCGAVHAICRYLGRLVFEYSRQQAGSATPFSLTSLLAVRPAAQYDAVLVNAVLRPSLLRQASSNRQPPAFKEVLSSSSAWALLASSIWGVIKRLSSTQEGDYIVKLTLEGYLRAKS